MSGYYCVSEIKNIYNWDRHFSMNSTSNLFLTTWLFTRFGLWSLCKIFRGAAKSCILVIDDYIITTGMSITFERLNIFPTSFEKWFLASHQIRYMHCIFWWRFLINYEYAYRYNHIVLTTFTIDYWGCNIMCIICKIFLSMCEALQYICILAAHWLWAG